MLILKMAKSKLEYFKFKILLMLPNLMKLFIF